jgi:hypothetical protein
VVVEAVADSGADAAVAEVVDSEDAIDRIHPHLLLSFPLLLSLLHPSPMYNAPSSIVPPRAPASPSRETPSRHGRPLASRLGVARN